MQCCSVEFKVLGEWGHFEGWRSLFFKQRFGGMGIDSNWKIKSGKLLLNFSPRDYWADIWAKTFQLSLNIQSSLFHQVFVRLESHFLSMRCLVDSFIHALMTRSSAPLYFTHSASPSRGQLLRDASTACHSCAIERFMAHESSRIISLLMVDFCLVGYFGKQWCEIGSHVHSLPCVGHSQG